MTVEADPQSSDKFKWLDGSKPFSVKEAYSLSRDEVSGAQWEGWIRIWKLRIQQRVKLFAWILAHGKLLTNEERVRRHMAASLICTRCSTEVEGVMHAVRDCLRAKEVWKKLVPARDEATFYSLEAREWLLWVMKAGGVERNETIWPERMLAVCWMQWC